MTTFLLAHLFYLFALARLSEASEPYDTIFLNDASSAFPYSVLFSLVEIGFPFSVVSPRGPTEDFICT